MSDNAIYIATAASATVGKRPGSSTATAARRSSPFSAAGRVATVILMARSHVS